MISFSLSRFQPIILGKVRNLYFKVSTEHLKYSLVNINQTVHTNLFWLHNYH